MTLKLGLAGDTMLGRTVGERLISVPPAALFADEVAAATHEADLFLLNLECAISERGEPWPDPVKPFFFRAPPAAAAVLEHLGVSCVTLANNHALDFGVQALLDTFANLERAGIAWVGAGADEAAARSPVSMERAGTRIAIFGVADHPAEFAAHAGTPGIAYSDLRQGAPDWLLDAIGRTKADIVVVSPHWGPNMVAEPLEYVRRAGAAFRAAGATVVVGHSAHVFHGIADGVIYDLGDFIDDYVTHPDLRNDLGLLFFVTFEENRPVLLEAVPLALDFCYTRLAAGEETAWIGRRFRQACAAFGTEVYEHRGRLVVDLGADAGNLRPPVTG